MTEESLFLAALERQDVEERQAFLDQTCAGNRELLRRVEQLLAAYAAGQAKLEPPTGPVATEDNCGTAAARTVIAGRYRLLEMIGAGGMGEVWVAKQTEPVQRKVALKLIRADRDSRQVVARFEAERQALALMDHPNIARVLDGGATESGRPFFVMELVNGMPLTRFCDEAKLTPRERLELFVPICQAVQHAHQKGIVHRDLKPANILVTLYDGRPVPKVIDFGVAKAVGGRLIDESLATQFGAVVGTFEYMAPEQAGFSALDVDTRADVYSLGVVLYELLTGLKPFDSKRLRQAALDEMVRILREEEPPRPSTRLSTDDSLPSLAALRQTDPKRLTALMRGELDWVVMKCLEKDRARRYETANGLARDIERYLADDVVEARPPSAAYRLRKFARKNRAALVTASLIALLLVTGVAASTWQAIRAMRAEAEAVAARDEATEQRRLAEENALKARSAAEAETTAKVTAQASEAETTAVLKFVETKVLTAAMPKEQGGLGHDVTVRRALEAALAYVAASFTDQPLIEARLRTTLAGTYAILGELPVATRQVERARALYAKHRGPDHPNTLASMNYLVGWYAKLGRWAEVLRLQEERVAMLKAKHGPDHISTLQALFMLANRYKDAGQSAKAIQVHEEVLERLRATVGPDHFDTLRSMQGLANTYISVGRRAEATKLREMALERLRATVGPDHQETHRCMQTLAATYSLGGRHAEAVKLKEELVTRKRAKHGPAHWEALASVTYLADSYIALGRSDDAMKVREQARADVRAALRHGHSNALQGVRMLAESYATLGLNAEAVELYEETLARAKDKHGPDHGFTLGVMVNLSFSYAAVGRHADELKLREEVLARKQAKLGPDATDTVSAMNNLALSLATVPDPTLRDPRRAVELATKAVAGAVRFQIAACRATLGLARYRTGDWKGAVADLEKAIGHRKADDPANASEGFFLAMARWQMGEKDKARDWFDKAVAWMAKGKKSDPELTRFRAEAAALLGVKDKP